MERPLERIMYVEDEPDIRIVAEMSLEVVGGFEVGLFASGTEALAGVAAFSPDLILLDVMMPEMDGPATLRALREAGCDAPIVFLTARVQKHDIRDYLEMGAVDVVAKPFDPMTLPDRLRGIWARV